MDQSSKALETALNNQPGQSTHQILDGWGELSTAAVSCIHVESLGLDFILDKLNYPFTSSIARNGGVMLVPYELWDNPIFVQCKQSDGKFVFTRYNSDLSKFHCLDCNNSSHCRHYVELKATTAHQSSKNADARAKAVLADIGSKCDQDGNIANTVKSSVPFPSYNSEQLTTMADRGAWVTRLIGQASRTMYWRCVCSVVHEVSMVV